MGETAGSGAVVARWAYAGFRGVARLRGGPALHPVGVLCCGALQVPGGAAPPWGVALLDEPGRYPVTARWSRAAGLPAGLPDGLGLAVRVEGAGGPGRPLDLLLTTAGPGRLSRHLPRPCGDALAGPYSSLMAYHVGGRPLVLAAFPHRDRAVPARVPAVRRALDRAPLVFDLRAAGPDEPWRTFAVLTLERPLPGPPRVTPGFDVYAHGLPELHPTPRLRALREAAYRGSREGRRGLRA
ncbi:hypothetical protein GCM10027168_17840 [Streptomyces capparidis]